MTFEISTEFVASENKKADAAHKEDYAALARQLERRGIAIEDMTARAAAYSVAVPTWGVGTGGTLTGSEVYGLTAYRLNPTGPISVFTQALTPVSVAANTTAEQTFSISSPNLLPAGSSVWINKPSWQAGLGIAGVRVSAANTLAVTYINTTSAAIVPTAETYVIGALNQVAPGAGNCVYQHTAAGLERTTAFVQALRAALSSATGGLGLFNGT